MSDLTDFLLARLAEDEAAAQILADGYPDFPGASYMAANLDLIEVTTGYARVLREVEAKRRIVEALVDAEDAVAQFKEPDATTYPSYWQEWGNRHALRLAVELLALPYADHPEFQEEWKP